MFWYVETYLSIDFGYVHLYLFMYFLKRKSWKSKFYWVGMALSQCFWFCWVPYNKSAAMEVYRLVDSAWKTVSRSVSWVEFVHFVLKGIFLDWIGTVCWGDFSPKQLVPQKFLQNPFERCQCNGILKICLESFQYIIFSNLFI